VQAALDTLGGGPVRMIVNTHHHDDHVGGNHALWKDAIVIAHDAVGRRMTTGLAILALNVEENPESWNAYDTLGEAYMTAGKRELAIANSSKPLELNPANTNATQMLERLKSR